jgi:hypothetical protein
MIGKGPHWCGLHGGGIIARSGCFFGKPDMWDIFSKVTVGLISTGILSLVSFFTVRFLGKKSSVDGDWFGVIFDREGNITKTDTFTLKLKGTSVHGKIKRTFPAEQVTRQWDFIGRIQNRSFYAIYWPEDQLNVSSGCWFLRQLDDRTFDGFYYRHHQDNEDGEPIQAVSMIISRNHYSTNQTRDEILGGNPRHTKARPALPQGSEGGTVVRFR